jgi:hypothetical protein
MFKVWRNQVGGIEIAEDTEDSRFGYGSVVIGVFETREAAEEFINNIPVEEQG